MTIGVISDWPGSSSYHTEILHGIEDYCRLADYSVVTLAVGRFGSDLPLDREMEILYEILDESQISGLITYTASVSVISGSRDLLSFLSKRFHRPIISLSVPVEGYPAVVIDNRSGFTDLCRHLIHHHGFRDIVFVSGPASNYDCRIRLEILRQVMAEKSLVLEDHRIWYGDLTPRSGSEAARHFFGKLKIRPEVIICANDYMAVGVWEEARKNGILLPWDTAVTGFDNIELSRYFELPFTTVRQPFYQQGYSAAETLHARLLGKTVPEITEIPAKMIRRESCGCLLRETTEAQEPLKNVSPTLKILHGERLDEAYNAFVEEKPGDPLIRAWNAFINETQVMDMKDAEVRHWFDELSERFCARPLPPDKKQELGRNLLRMQQIMVDYFKEADLFGKAIQEGSIEEMMEMADNFIQWLMTDRDTSAQAVRFREMLLSLGIKNAWLVLFRDPENPFGKPAECAFAMIDGELRVGDKDTVLFGPRKLLPESHEPEDWTSLLVQALFEGPDKIGYLVYDNRMWNSDTNEMLRRRLSSALRAVRITRNLSEANSSLQEEIRLRKESEKQLTELTEQLKNLSLKDELTGLFNRRGFLTIGEQQIKHYLREKLDFLILFADMDGLKQINDTHGHSEGDLAIQTAARILESSFREADIVARLGGDEFTVLLGAAGKGQTGMFHERIRKASAALSSNGGKGYTVSLSLGFVAASEYPEAGLRELLDAADRRLYEMKRNRGKPATG